MSATDTKERILDAAERLFARQGLEGFSLRAVTAEAGVNLAAVNYHFGSKAALLRSLVRRAFASVNAEQLCLLDALEVEIPAPTVEDLLVAFATPVFALFDTDHAGEWGPAWMAARETDGPDRERPPMQFADTDVTRRYHTALRRALPYVPPDELWWRFERANNLLMANQGKRAVDARRSGGTRSPVREERHWLLTFLAGALRAPASTTAASSGGRDA